MSAPDNERDLALIDAALVEGRATSSDPRERELEELALALRDDAPLPAPDFERELRARVDDGFARPRRFRLPRIAVLPKPVFAGAAAVLLAVAVAVGVLSSGGSSGTDGASPQIAQEPGETSVASPELAAPSTTAPDSDAARGGAEPDRRVERTAEMTIASPVDEMQTTADRVGQIAEQFRGYVVSSRISTGDDTTPGGTFVLRIPTNRLETALAELGKLGTVTGRSESSQDMTAPYRNTQDRLGNLLLERRATEEKLDDADGDEATQLRFQLGQINAEIRDLQSRMDDLRQRTVFSTVTLTLEEKGDSGAATGGSDGPGGAWDDALATLEDALEIAIRAVGVAVPFALLGLVGWLGAGLLRRRRREAALY